ncbi:hypothetical protein IFU30_03560 [Plantibacter sp. CFBP 8798]|uniref:hypothetical protein n=1 Tax=Plantibacter sp. CFBP 8798 TaxID=2775268 RepID=UPI001784B56E|nr:hypothetical protein [Plantibacter sp. CFBP 8798]MBD8465338.1 hypothetical protein [Plantibacter sp. CFBP 8798]
MELANDPSSLGEDESRVTGSLISYCVRDAIDSIFPKLDDPKIKDAAQRVVTRWRRLSSRPDADLARALHGELSTLESAVEAATAGFLPRVSGFLGILHPGLLADQSIPAMKALRDLNKAANEGLHGTTTREEAVELLDRLLERLVDLVAPLAVTVQQYLSLIEAGDFESVSSLLMSNSDPRIRVYLFDRVRDPLLAQTLEVSELLPGPSLWLAHSYIRHLAAEDATAFNAFVDRVEAQNLLTADVAAQLLVCATLAGADSIGEVDRLSHKAGDRVRTEFVVRWLRRHIDAVPEAEWWKILARVVDSLEPSTGLSRSPHGVDELLDVAIARLPEIAEPPRARFSSAVIKALLRVDTDSPYTVLFHFDHAHLRARTTSGLIIESAVRVAAIAESRGTPIDLSALSELGGAALARGVVAPAIELSAPELGIAIAGRAYEAVVARVSGEYWPDQTDLQTLQVILPLVEKTALSRLSEALGEAPPSGVLCSDLDNATETRPDWFRSAQWVAHLPEEARPASWTRTLREAAEQGTEFGPLPPVNRLARPSALQSPLGDVDLAGVTVSEFVSILNSVAGVGEHDDPRFAMNLQETITSHTENNRATWAGDHNAIAQVRDLWARLTIVRALKSESGDAPRLRWEQLQTLWAHVVVEASRLVTIGDDPAKPAVVRLASEILDQLRHRVSDRPRQSGDIHWWAHEVLPATVELAAWVGSDEHDFGMPALFSLRGHSVHLLVELSSPVDDDAERDAALGRALDLLADVASADPSFARSVGHWAQWLIQRDPAWWNRSAGHLIGLSSSAVIHETLLTANWESGYFAFSLLNQDLALLNSFASQVAEDAAAPALSAVLFDVLPVTAITEPTWSAIFRDRSSAEQALRYLFPDHSVLGDPGAARRLRMMQWIAADPARAGVIWPSIDVLASSPDLSDKDLFAFTAVLARNQRGAPMSTHHLSDRLIRSLARPDAVATLESICAGNLGGDRMMAQYDMEEVYTWFQSEAQTLPPDLRVRVGHALFEVGFVNDFDR